VRGLDYAWAQVPPAAVKAAGFSFAARYLSHDPSKNLTRPEADALLAAGVAIVVVWEDTAQGALRGHAGGWADAVAADAQARACGLPGAFIYFAADWDAATGQQAAINDYLDGCATVIGHARTGLYGGFWPLSRARAARKASKFWGTLAWSGGMWDPKQNPGMCFVPDVMQGAQVTIDGVSVDLDTAAASGDFGQWPRPTAPGNEAFDMGSFTEAQLIKIVQTAVESVETRDTLATTALWWLDKALSGTVPPGASPQEAALIASVQASIAKLATPAA
jgi:Domain of unknown function (DUF1906)